MSVILLTPFDIARRFIGVKEIPGAPSHPFIAYCHSTCPGESNSDEIPWCSSFVNGVAEICGLPRSRSRLARSWLTVGQEVKTIAEARIGSDIVVIERGEPWQGHVGFFAGYWETQGLVSLLAGNQGDAVSIANFPVSRIVGIRSLS